MKFICTLCNCVLDEVEGLPDGPDQGKTFEQLPENWACPDCAARKEFFQSCSCVHWPLYEATKAQACSCGERESAAFAA